MTIFHFWGVLKEKVPIPKNPKLTSPPPPPPPPRAKASKVAAVLAGPNTGALKIVTNGVSSWAL